MSGTTARESNAGPRDEEGKTMMNSDEEQKPNDASEEPNPMPSNPPMPVADTERSSDKMTMQPSGSEEEKVDSPLKKKENERFTEDPDQTHSDVIPESGSIQSSNTEGAPSSTQLIKTSTGGFTRRIFLFEMRLTRNDVEQGNLFIPVEIALDHFPPLPKHRRRNYEQKIKISDADTHRDWFMTLRYDPHECVFLIQSEWRGFAQLHNLKAADSIRLYKPIPHSHDNHFLIEHIRNLEARHEITIVTEFKPENFLFRRKLGANEIRFKRLVLPRKDVRNYIPALGIPAETHSVERLYFTDAQDKEWCVNVAFYFDTYLVMKGWEEFVNEYLVEVGDEIRFYKPVQPWNSRHFLIEHVRSAAARTSGTAGNGGKGDDGDDSTYVIIDSISGGNDHGAGGGGRRSGGGSPKGKKIDVGNCCMA